MKPIFLNMMNRIAIITTVLFGLLLTPSCKTALTDKTEYESGWEFEQPKQQKPNVAQNKKNNAKQPDNKTVAKTETKAAPTTSPTPKPKTEPASGIVSHSLKKEVDQWLGTPYRHGGTTKQGVDCSGFCGNVYKNVYNITLGRSAQDIYDQSKPINRSAAKEGDLVFFKINSSRVSHVGIYLSQNKFVHASTSRGVIISDLDEAYWTKYYFAVGRVSG